MALHQKKWWKRIFKKKEHKVKVDVIKDLDAMTEYLKELPQEIEPILKEIEKLRNLEQERGVATKSIVQINLDAQAKVIDSLLEKYEYVQNDVDINMLRLKKVANEFLRNAKHHGMKDLVNEKKEDHRWRILW
jgi:hypothetical protein